MLPGKYKTSFLGGEIPILYVTESSQAIPLLSRLCEQSEELHAIDTETECLPKYIKRPEAALSPHLSKVRLIQVFTGRTAIVFDCKRIGQDTIFRGYLEQGRFVGHNSVFDLQYFYKQFGVTKCNIGCTYLVAKLLFHATRPTDTGLSASLRSLVNITFGEEIIKEMATSDWSEPELSFEQVEYAALDAIATYHLAKKLAPKLESLGLLRIYKLYKAAQHPIAKIQLNGLKLDVDSHRELIVGWREKLYASKKKLIELTSLSRITSTTIADYLKRTLPTETLSVWPRTETGKLATDSHVFADFDYLEIVKPFSEFQKNEKLCTAFGHKLIEQVSPETNRLHASYKLAGARTGRLSCSQPNLQQLPRDNSVRKNFIPEPGNVLVCADYSQIELRVAAEVSRDPTMLYAYQNGIDLHKLTASKITKKHIEDVTTLDRQSGKSFNFGMLFGLGAPAYKHYAKKAYGVEVTDIESEKGVREWRDLYSIYRSWHKDIYSSAMKKGYVTTPCGKRRCLDTDTSLYHKNNSYGASANTPIQGGAAECVLYALVRINKVINKYFPTAKLVNCVHDELMVECEPKDEERLEFYVEECMELGFLDVFPNGIDRGLVECKSGKSWGECKG